MDVFLIFLVFFSPLIYASTSILPLTIIEGLSFFLLFLFLFFQALKGRISLIKIPISALILFIALVIFQLISLPQNLFSFLSPKTPFLYETFRINLHGPFTLSIYREATLAQLLQILTFLAIFLVTLNSIDTKRQSRRLVMAIIISGFLYSLFGIISKLTAPLLSFSTFTNRDHFAAYIGMIIPLTIAYALIEPNKTKRIIYVFAASVMGVALLLSLSRAGMICFSFGLILFLLLLKKKRPLKRSLNLIIILFLSLGLILVIAGTGTVLQRLESLKSPVKAMGGRMEVIKDIPRLIIDFPFFGTGLGTFGEIFQKYKSFSVSAFYRFSHNEPLQLLVETGIPGFLLINAFFLVYLKNIILLWLKRKNPYAIFISLGCLIGLFSISLHSLFDFVFHIPANAVLFFIILGLVFRTVYYKEPQSDLPIPQWEFQPNPFIRWVFITIIFLSFIFVELLIVNRYRAEAAFNRIKEKNVSVSGTDAIFEYKKVLRSLDASIALNPLNSQFYAKKADFLSEVANREDTKGELLYLNRSKEQGEVFSEAAESYKRAINLNPTNASYHFKLGWLYSILDSQELTGEEFKKALTLDPHNKKMRDYIDSNK